MALFQVRLVYDIGGSGYNRRATSALHFDADLGVDVTDLTNAAQAAYDGWGASVRNSFPAESQLHHAEAFTEDLAADPDYPSPGHPTPYKLTQVSVAVESTGAPIAGTDSGDANPPNVAWVCTFRTALAGRSHRGRIYLPPVSFDESGVDGETTTMFADGVADNVQSMISDILDSATTPNSYQHVVVSKVLGVTTQVLLYTCGPRIDTQRRRLRRETL